MWLTCVEVISSPQSSSTIAATFLVLTPCTYISAMASISARDLRRAKPFFKLAVRRRSITENPFSDMKRGFQINDSRRGFVSQETIERVIKACANHGWRPAFALPGISVFACRARRRNSSGPTSTG